ncbi:hypothetical protein [Aurantimonas sp. Leaf443]|uniref:hypothetical protein n=1 Tax=Aurantimonas sp. Leaf443 TaxID=1736378 RepID=UPI0006F76376|nr:hypothetical protein [Aurantimonas sp. Leaf443]KQT85584.1 hypothetical protein ASG48_10280 [Aurantimonas sp. Leaf443]
MTTDQHTPSSQGDREAVSPIASMADFDPADYRPYLNGLELSDEQASELLRILWDMMRMCVEMDIPAESWGQIVSPLFLAAAADSPEVD